MNQIVYCQPQTDFNHSSDDTATKKIITEIVINFSFRIKLRIVFVKSLYSYSDVKLQNFGECVALKWKDIETWYQLKGTYINCFLKYLQNEILMGYHSSANTYNHANILFTPNEIPLCSREHVNRRCQEQTSIFISIFLRYSSVRHCLS